MLKKSILSSLLIFILIIPVFAKDVNLEKMEDALARGYLAASKNDIDEAFDNFTKSIYFAKKAKSWKGLADAGNAFSALGEPKKALSPFKLAYKIASSQKDWRGLVAISYSYASLPVNLNTQKHAFSALNLARKIASSKNDWRGLSEIRKASLRLSEIAKKSGSLALYNKYVKIAEDLSDFKTKDATTPPPGWNPYGESIAGPKKISPEAQIAMRKSADKDIQEDLKYQEKIKEKENYDYYVIYRQYYNFPYYHTYYGYWHPLSHSQVYTWAHRYLSRYRLINGIYIYRY